MTWKPIIEKNALCAVKYSESSADTKIHPDGRCDFVLYIYHRPAIIVDPEYDGYVIVKLSNDEIKYFRRESKAISFGYRWEDDGAGDLPGVV